MLLDFIGTMIMNGILQVKQLWIMSLVYFMNGVLLPSLLIVTAPVWLTIIFWVKLTSMVTFGLMKDPRFIFSGIFSLLNDTIDEFVHWPRMLFYQFLCTIKDTILPKEIWCISSVFQSICDFFEPPITKRISDVSISRHSS